MPANVHSLVLVCLALVGLTAVVGFRMLFCRVREMRGKRIHPQKAATSVQMAAYLAGFAVVVGMWAGFAVTLPA